MVCILLALLLKPVLPLEPIYPIAKVEKGFITNIDEICGGWKDDIPGSKIREGICIIPKSQPIEVWENGVKYIFTGKVVIFERDENQSIKTFIGKTKKSLILWCALV